MEPIINHLIDSGCNINKINIQENYNEAIANNVKHTPTMIINNQRIVGEFTVQDVKDLISKAV